MKSVKYVGIDPGTTTGLAVYEYGKFETLTLPAAKVLDWLDELHTEKPPNNQITALCIEKFATAGRISKYGIETIDLVGQVKGWAHCKNVNVHIYVPQARKGYQEHDLPTPHQNDALAHLKHLMADLKVS